MIFTCTYERTTVSFDTEAASFTSIRVGSQQMIGGETPVFKISLMDKKGNRSVFSATDAKKVSVLGKEVIYEGFSCGGLTVVVYFPEDGTGNYRIRAKVPGDLCAEWVDFPRLALQPLIKNGGPGAILFPFNEGALVDDIRVREASPAFHHWEAGYPSQGCYAVFPNMVFSQFLAYVTESGSLYVGAHDEKRGVKQIDFYPEGDTVVLQNKVFTGASFGQEYEQDFPWVICGAGNTWQQAADVYKTWLRSHMPENMPKIKDNPKIPAWYKESPVVISYPVRGIHDMDRMTPNALFPYTNALPMVRSIQEKTHSKIMVLLIHWEGTAPWAPPYVWPPYGGEKPLLAFRDTLHEEGNLLGVYCSGFGFTKHSNLTGYEGESLLKEKHYLGGMCAAPSGRVKNSLICCAQRSGYDVCPASDIGKSILNEAYQPLFENDLDYAQILDQNHGGGQYFCYGKNHGHAPVPGAWMTENMQNFLFLQNFYNIH